MGNVVELFPDGPPDEDGISELLDHYGQIMDWGSAPPLAQAECLFELAKELVGIGHHGAALDTFRASNRAIAELDGSEVRNALKSVINSHYRRACEIIYGNDEESWPIDERNFLASSG